MSKPKPGTIYTANAGYVNRSKKEFEVFQELTVRMQTIETALLLLASEEEAVLISVFKHLTEFVRKQEENIVEIKRHNLLELLLEKEFFITNTSVMIKRFSLYLVAAIIESMNVLQDLEEEKTLKILELCLQFYVLESDGFCMEYLSVVINMCLNDPQVARVILDKTEYLDKFFSTVQQSDNPDIIWHSFEALHKILQLQDIETMRAFTAHSSFPVDRVICDLTNEFNEIRSAALKVVKDLVSDTGDDGLFASNDRTTYMLQQLTKMFCDDPMSELSFEVIDVLATAMRSERITQLFFEQNLFARMVENLEANANKYPFDVKCKVIAIFAENAKYTQFLPRLHASSVTDLFLECLLQNELTTATHVLTGLNRLMKLPGPAYRIVEAYDDGVLSKLLTMMLNEDISIKTREQSAELINNLLLFKFHNTATELMHLDVAEALGRIFAQGLAKLSIDYILSMLNIIEQLAQNNEYRSYLAEKPLLTQTIALLLKNAFSAAVLVNNIFRCLCTLVDEENVRSILLQYFIAPSIKRGLQSRSNLVKTSVTNFIMQTTRFPEFVHEYIDTGVLEVLMLHQKHAFCVSTWGPAIDSILSKCPSLKFCIRNHLSFTDSTAGNDFLVSKKKFDDFRIFQHILKEEVSPLQPILVVNFDRAVSPPELVVEVPIECFQESEALTDATGWCYCRKPGDEYLPKYLDELNEELEKNGLVQNPKKMQRTIDFDNVAKRAKVIADVVTRALSDGLKSLDLNGSEDCSAHTVKCHLRDLTMVLHCNFIPIGMVRSGCQFERAILFKALADQIGLPCTLQRSVDGRILFNEVPLPVEIEHDIHCDKKTMKYLPWRMLRPTHIVDLMFNVGELYPLQSRQALQYLKLY